MKKLVLFSVLAAAAAAGAFALPEFKAGAGAGGFFTSDSGGGVEVSAGGQTMSMKTPYAGGGGFAFVDLTYAELSLGVFGGGGTTKLSVGSISLGAGMSVTGLDIGLLLKYPFAIGEKLSLFPLVGSTCRVMLSAQDTDGNKVRHITINDHAGKEADPGDFSALWFNFGGGLDVLFTDHVFLRGEALYGLRTVNKYEKDFDKVISDIAIPGVDTKALPGHGFLVKLAVGYRF
ncbi:MAG: outer membrane beta-barrel protein [Treponema sp.]|jgi:hypothetical protein|nr:outer membrane beta-barrel protein [Treponema sp.]